MLLLDEQTRKNFSAYLGQRRVMLRGRPSEIDRRVWFAWLTGLRGGIEFAEVVILARAFGPSVYTALGREDLAETKKLRFPRP